MEEEMAKYNSLLQEMAETTDTDYWNDSCAVSELEYAIPNGAVGATTNPSIVLNVLKKEYDLWEDRILEIIKDNPAFDEDEVSWQLIEEMAIKGSNLLMPVFEKHKGLKGRISIQTNAKFYRDAQRMAAQAVKFDKLAPNMQVKIPATAAGIEAMEEATYQGVNINATVCFTVPQALAVGAAVERGLKRREGEGKDTKSMTPVCTIMVGRLDDWIKIVANKENISIDPAYFEIAGVAAIKRALLIYKERGYKTRMLAAAYRNQLHWSELIGGNIIHTIPYKWQKRYNSSTVEINNTTDLEIDQNIIKELSLKFDDFRKAYEPEGMEPDEFETYGATARTLRGFIGGYTQLVEIIRDLMIPNPEV
jgi:transaldolase